MNQLAIAISLVIRKIASNQDIARPATLSNPAILCKSTKLGNPATFSNPAILHNSAILSDLATLSNPAMVWCTSRWIKNF
jgi:hypothetical protein